MGLGEERPGTQAVFILGLPVCASSLITGSSDWAGQGSLTSGDWAPTAPWDRRGKGVPAERGRGCWRPTMRTLVLLLLVLLDLGQAQGLLHR